MSLDAIEQEISKFLQPYFLKWFNATGIKPASFVLTARGEHGALYGSIYILDEGE